MFDSSAVGSSNNSSANVPAPTLPAALNGFDSGHIALAVGDGDPVRYFAGVALLGRLQIVGIDGAD